MATAANLVMHVRASREPGASDGTNDLTSGDAIAGVHVKSAQMPVNRFPSVAVIQNNRQSIADMLAR